MLKYCLTIKEAAEYFNIDENKLYELTDKPGCQFVLFVGRKFLIRIFLILRHNNLQRIRKEK